MKHLKTFEAFVDRNGNLNSLSNNLTINSEYFDFDLYDVDYQTDISYIEGKIYFKPDILEFEGVIIYDYELDKCFSEFDEDFYGVISGYRVEFEKFCEKVKREIIR